MKIVTNLFEDSKIVHEWNGHIEFLAVSQVIDNSGQYLLLQQIIYRKHSALGAPAFTRNQLKRTNIWPLSFSKVRENRAKIFKRSPVNLGCCDNTQKAL